MVKLVLILKMNFFVIWIGHFKYNNYYGYIYPTIVNNTLKGYVDINTSIIKNQIITLGLDLKIVGLFYKLEEEKKVGEQGMIFNLP